MVTAACAEQGGGSGDRVGDLVGVVWRLDDASIAALAGDVGDTAVVSLEFADGQVSGRSGCNSYFGRYTAGDDGSLAFDALGGTEMACEEPLMSLEAAYLSALGAVTRFSIDGGELTLDGADLPLTFVEEVPPASLPLVGTTWNLTTVASGDAVSSTIAGTEVSLVLAEDGTASGSAGCNRFTGSYSVEGDALSFGPLATTRMACAEDVMAQEAAFLERMDAVAGSSIEGSRLTLTDVDGAMLLGFTGVPAGATA